MATAQKIGPKNGFINRMNASDTPSSIARKVRVSSFAYIVKQFLSRTCPSGLIGKADYHDSVASVVGFAL
ncbi:MAG: hypothetical protein Marn2KO_31830 [Marinobacter nauticus]